MLVITLCFSVDSMPDKGFSLVYDPECLSVGNHLEEVYLLAGKDASTTVFRYGITM